MEGSDGGGGLSLYLSTVSATALIIESGGGVRGHSKEPQGGLAVIQTRAGRGAGALRSGWGYGALVCVTARKESGMAPKCSAVFLPDSLHLSGRTQGDSRYFSGMDMRSSGADKVSLKCLCGIRWTC